MDEWGKGGLNNLIERREMRWRIMDGDADGGDDDDMKVALFETTVIYAEQGTGYKVHGTNDCCRVLQATLFLFRLKQKHKLTSIHIPTFP